ncbi:hypothetical protein IPC1147_32935 [Pseudomonas aeruginosa]|uniref:hypothetical protein n=1 Tax=Pseudomonas aeruginosa TaxID=287 RepID=UPI000F5314F3|nr:hypothetical protein [Pseudomonas aeruginosa]MBA5106140.1 hypothetical protein [Pseudomonas aeruginosa]MBD1300168.1 hypothetical protein [Pseudomonas aeruginosa]MBD1340849.1 hypothetical protein [Pseudomonas aeruginosa]MBH3592909.1 hypothetical protein [Pseudomonas aeruginosa]MCO2528516.1 hypothetical protein [Pseudomonas aeruginosa]
MSDSGLDDEYVRKHALPGEDWEQARRRLTGIVSKRFTELPACVRCSSEADSVVDARERHALRTCLGQGEAWPVEALDQSKAAEAHAAFKHRTEDLAAIVRNRVRGAVALLSGSEYPINTVMAASKAQGYLQLAADLELLERSEYISLSEQVYQVEAKARYDFILQYRSSDPTALPWRLIEPSEE